MHRQRIERISEGTAKTITSTGELSTNYFISTAEEGTTWIKQYAEKRSAKDPTFKTAYEEEAALLALVRARQRSNLTQQNLAKTLRVSQPYIAQIERGSKPISLSFMVRYANAVGATIQITPQQENAVHA
jgi:DNA-binding XRE family transcriptional regulator